MNLQTIGVLGGMGPDASARLYQTMIDLARGEFGALKNEEYPEIVIYSIPVPDFISDMNRAEEAMFLLKDRVRKLSMIGVTMFGLACNSAHTALTEIEQETKVPFVSIPRELAGEISRRGYTKVGLLASPITIYSGVYHRELLDKGVEIVLPEHEYVEELGRIIEDIVGGEFKTVKKKLLVIADSLKKQKIEAIVLGCTELPMVFPRNYSLPTLDSTEILARALLKRYYQREEE